MRKFLLFAAMACTLLSCSESQESITNVEKLPINISVNQQTRANDEVFETGDNIGIYVVNYNGSTAGTLAATGNQADNSQFTYDGSKWSPENSIYWKDNTTATDFYAYYPYSSSISSITAYPFSVKSNQSDNDDFWASDFLWGKATKISPTPNPVSIQTSHSLSRILIDIKPGTGFTETSWNTATKSIKICEVKTSATINLSTGVATASGNSGEIIPLAASETGTTLSYKAMMIPQVVEDNTKLVVVTVDGTDYVYRKGYTFSPNTIHKFTITVNKNGSNVNVSIGEWSIDSTTNEGNAEDESESITNTIPNNQIWYTATEKVTPNSPDVFGATILSNEWNSTTGEGIITLNEYATTIGTKAFEGCTNLISIQIPSSVKTIDERAFSGCSYLKSPEKILTNITHIGSYAFYGCNFQDLTIPTGVETIGDHAFMACNIKSLSISDSVTHIGDWAFGEEFGNSYNYIDYLHINNIERSFGNNIFGKTMGFIEFTGTAASSDGHSLIIGDELVAIAKSYYTRNTDYGSFEYIVPNGVKKIGDYCFALGDSNTANWVRGDMKIVLNNEITHIGNSAFRSCYLKDFNTDLSNIKEIEDLAFYYTYYKDETNLHFTQNLEYIGREAFGYSGVNAIYLNSTTPPTLEMNYGLGEDSPFIGMDDDSDFIDPAFKIYIPIGARNAYLDAMGYWREIAWQLIEYEF
ncbi:MAG: fimbrillin family protein [Alistipes sp.]|nr:fimbrillin family protein [Alistipes sp.]